jgi:hypothetical protein
VRRSIQAAYLRKLCCSYLRALGWVTSWSAEALQQKDKTCHSWEDNACNTFHVGYTLYREIFKATDAFTAPRFSATGMLSAARCMRVLSMTQNAWQLITFRMNKNNKPVYNFCAVGNCYRCHELFLTSKHLASSVLWHGSLYFKATRICVWHLRELRICWKVSAKILT